MPLDPTTTEEEALIAVLDAFDKAKGLRERFILKGGNALRWVYQGSRASVDLDFSSTVQHTHQSDADSVEILEEVKTQLDSALQKVAAVHRFESLVVQSAKVLPKKRDVREFPSLELRVGYSRKPGRGAPFAQSIKVEVTLNEVVCDYTPWRSGSLRVMVGTLEEIISEKLRALLQQEKRNRYRSSDVFDIWFFWTRARKRLDLDDIGQFLLKKSAGRNSVGEVSKVRFRSEEIRRRAEFEYAEIEKRLLKGEKLPPFSEAYNAVLTLVDKLAIPEA